MHVLEYAILLLLSHVLYSYWLPLLYGMLGRLYERQVHLVKVCRGKRLRPELLILRRRVGYNAEAVVDKEAFLNERGCLAGMRLWRLL